MEFNLGESVVIVLTLVVLEAMLSFDNAAILAVMSRRLPVGQGRNRALNYGLLIAYGLRVLAILGAAYLYRNWTFQILGGLYLLFLFVRHAFMVLRHREREHHAREGPVKGWLGLTPLAVIVLQIGLIDLAFALDQIAAAVAFVQDHPYAYLLIIIAATIGLLSLRLLAPAMSRLMDWLPLLEHMAYVAVGFVGLLLILSNMGPVVEPLGPLGIHVVFEPPNDFFASLGFALAPDNAGYDLIDPVKVTVTLALFVVPVLTKFFFGIPASRPRHTPVTKALETAKEAQRAGPTRPRKP